MTHPSEIIELRRRHLRQMVSMREATQRLHVELLPHRFNSYVTRRDTRRMVRSYLRPFFSVGRRRQWALGWVEGGLRGYVLFALGRENPDVMTLSRDFVVVTDIAVDPEWHGRGIADALLEAVSERARAAGADDVLAHVWGGNHASS